MKPAKKCPGATAKGTAFLHPVGPKHFLPKVILIEKNVLI
jgi:hypothetical protein